MVDLTPKQQIVLATAGHQLVTGGPGSGKTTVSILKAAKIARETLQPGQRVLFLSFARATVSRVLEAIDEEKDVSTNERSRIEVDTYHSFFWRLLKTHGYLVGLPRRITKVAPQLEFNGGKLRDMLAEGAVQVEGGVAYPVRIERLDEFFTALSCGLIAASQKRSLPANYSINHIYPSLATGGDSVSKALKQGIEEFYSGKPLAVMEFGKPSLHNERIYTAEVFGLPDFEGSITIVHLFFGKFKVISMLSKYFEMPD